MSEVYVSTRCVLVSLAMCFVASTLRAEEMALPANLQSAMFKKIFGYDRSFEGQNEFSVLVVYANETSELELILDAFDEVGVTATGVPSEKLADKIQFASILYVLPGVDTSPVKPLCAEHGVLSISGVPALAEEGEVSVGLGTENGRPRIVVNLGRAKSENHQFAADLLRLSKVVP